MTISIIYFLFSIYIILPVHSSHKADSDSVISLYVNVWLCAVMTNEPYSENKLIIL